MVEDREHFLWDCIIAKKGHADLMNKLIRLINLKEDLFQPPTYTQIGNQLKHHHKHESWNDKIVTSIKRPDMAFWQESKAHIIWARNLQKTGHMPEDWDNITTKDTIHPAYLNYVHNKLNIDTHIGGVTHNPALNIRSWDWDDKDQFLVANPASRTLLDISATPTLRIQQGTATAGTCTNFWLVTEAQWNKSNHKGYRRILTIPKDTRTMVLGTYWKGEPNKTTKNQTILHIVAPNSGYRTLPALDLEEAQFRNTTVQTFIQRQLLTKSRTATAILTGVVTGNLQRFVNSLKLHETKKTNLASSIARQCVQHYHKQWQARNDQVPHQPVSKKPKQQTDNTTANQTTRVNPTTPHTKPTQSKRTYEGRRIQWYQDRESRLQRDSHWERWSTQDRTQTQPQADTKPKQTKQTQNKETTWTKKPKPKNFFSLQTIKEEAL